ISCPIREPSSEELDGVPKPPLMTTIDLPIASTLHCLYAYACINSGGTEGIPNTGPQLVPSPRTDFHYYDGRNFIDILCL
ncbi:MAG: hypothetical protein ACTH8G_07190, partial [Glutamicibacter arilaitensis]